MKLYDTGVYLLNGQKIVPENQADFPVSREEAAKIQLPIQSWKHTILPEIWRNCRLNLIN